MKHAYTALEQRIHAALREIDRVGAQQELVVDFFTSEIDPIAIGIVSSSDFDATSLRSVLELAPRSIADSADRWVAATCWLWNRGDDETRSRLREAISPFRQIKLFLAHISSRFGSYFDRTRDSAFVAFAISAIDLMGSSVDARDDRPALVRLRNAIQNIDGDAWKVVNSCIAKTAGEARQLLLSVFTEGSDNI